MPVPAYAYPIATHSRSGLVWWCSVVGGRVGGGGGDRSLESNFGFCGALACGEVGYVS